MRVARASAWALGCLVVGALGAAFVARSPSHGRALAAEPHAYGAMPSLGAGATYESAKAELLARTTNAEMLAKGSPESFNRLADAAGYRLDYARLSGDYASYSVAEAHLAAAFVAVDLRGVRSGETKTGPFLLKAQLDYTLHRSKAAIADLEGPERDARLADDHGLLADVLALRGAATFALGDYEAGLASLREAVLLAPRAGHHERLAIALAKVGEDDEALRLLSQTPGATPRARAWLALQRAEIHHERGRLTEARRELEAARDAFPGDWHTDEHLAELDVEEGKHDAARRAYESLVARTGDPEFMDALAGLVALTAKDRAADLRRRAHAIYMDRLTKLPEATYGHALEHALREVADPAFAVTIAEKNRDLRPNGEAYTRLAQAYYRAGRTSDAVAAIRVVLASRWTSGESYATAAVVLTAHGDTKGARAADEKGVARDPYAGPRLAWLPR